MQAAAVGDGHVHTAPSAVKVLIEFAHLAPASYREFSVSWRSAVPDEDGTYLPDCKPGGLQISLVRFVPALLPIPPMKVVVQAGKPLLDV